MEKYMSKSQFPTSKNTFKFYKINYSPEWNEMKTTKYHTVITVPKSNQKSWKKTRHKLIHLAHIHMTTLSSISKLMQIILSNV